MIQDYGNEGNSRNIVGKLLRKFSKLVLSSAKMPLFKKGTSGNLSKKSYDNSEKEAESVGKPNGANSTVTPPRPPKNTANKSNPPASVVGQHTNPNIPKETKKDGQPQNSSKGSPKAEDKPGGAVNAKTPPKFIFYCQLAHGSPTSEIQGFTNVKELYGKISESYKIDVKEILFCTLNTFKVDMEKLLGGQIALDDFIFAHIKGERATVKLQKIEPALGLTITDNGAGLAFIKRIKEDSLIDKEPGIAVGDHIESINGENVVGSRHYDVARKLRDISVNDEITFGLVKPQKVFEGINFGKSSQKTPAVNQMDDKKVGTGRATLRLRSTGPATVEEELPVWEINAAKKVDDLLESFIGIRDAELADSLVELSKNKTNPSEFTGAVEANFAEFEFPDDFVFDIWGMIDDAKNGRL